ncbi:MAG: chromosome segregation protein SMC [Mollicutes bacterium]|nr:chromosome segregation protein SMC [Mollicutes bacterium]
MYLKEIKAHGFKSFADRIRIELNPSITGIVGPNGSGKSNIVDAIRWVLGEQSVKSLRGNGNMTDVIFSGSKTRNPLNVASVTLVFDNSDHYLPIDFDEVSIKRRVYSDGTNEYYINGEKCRLKDITDLLLDSGIAKESFNIISQGKIDEILSNKPLERRVVFEEAAGVLKYKKRKEEALNKLERTHQNMNRVNDIINELEVQVEPLKEQKEKALEYLKVKEELEEIEIALITNDITKINYQYQQNKRKIDELNEELVSITTTTNTNEVKIEEFKTKLNELNEKINVKQQELLELTSKVEKINSQKQIILERKKYEVEDSKLHDNLIVLKEKELALKNKISNIQNEIDGKQLELNQVILEYNKENHNIEKVKEDKNNLLLDLSNQLKVEAALKTKIENLKESIENNSSLPSAVKNVLNNPKLRGIHNAIGNVIEVNDEYSIAISTSLGIASSFIIVDNETCTKEAINYLKSTNGGRATFFPLNIIKPKTIEQDVLNILKASEGFIDIASNLVKYDPKYTNIINNQLGNVIVAKDIDTANLISKKINYRYKIVTLDGELLHVGGSITGGTKGVNRNIITEKYELENNLRDLDNLTNVIKNIENMINECDYQLKLLEEKLYVINKKKINLEEYINHKKDELSEQIMMLNNTNSEINGTTNIINNSLSNEEEKVLKEYYEALKEKDEVNNELKNLIFERNNLAESLEEFEHEMKKENNLFNIKNNELKNLEIEVNRMDVKLDTLLNTLNEVYGMTYENAIHKYKLEIEENLARTKVNSLKRKLKEIGVVNLGAPEEYNRISKRYEFLIKQRDDLVNAENTLIDIIKELDQVMEKEFIETFRIINENFKTTFRELFKGGTAELKLTEPNNILETGIEIIASPPGKKLTSISLLSGGEKTFTAISLLFAILKSRPLPFCVFDEVEAALDEVNVVSFGEYLLKLKEKTQFILVTHKKKTMEYVDTLYGITMQESGVSKLVSVKLEDI